jgi:hypothetical protein
MTDPVVKRDLQLDHADEEALTFEVSDEALERAAGTEKGAMATGETQACLSWFPCC